MIVMSEECHNCKFDANERLIECEKCSKSTGKIELRRHPDICCPEPSCDNVPFDFKQCKSCGHICSDCKVYEAMKELIIARLQTLPPSIRISIG